MLVEGEGMRPGVDMIVRPEVDADRGRRNGNQGWILIAGEGTRPQKVERPGVRIGNMVDSGRVD